MKPAQLAINTVSLRGSLEEMLRASAAAGFPAVEIPLSQIRAHLETHSVSHTVGLLNQLGLSCIGGFDGPLLVNGDAGAMAANRELIAGNARLLKELGQGKTQNLVLGVDCPGLPTLADAAGVVSDALDAAAQQAGPGVNLLLEFNWGSVKTLALAAAIVRQCHSTNVGILFDPAHYYCTPTKSEDLTATTVPLIGHVHVDNMRCVPAELANCNSDRVLPGTPGAALDLPQLLGQLEALGYDSWFSIEMFSAELWDLPAAEAAARMYGAMASLTT